MVCVELCPCAKNIVHAVDQSSFLMRETLTRVTVYAPWWLVLVHAYLQVCAHVVRSWGTSVSYRNQLRHIPWPDYLGTRCFVTSSSCSSLFSHDRGARGRVATAGQTWFSTVWNFRSNVDGASSQNRFYPVVALIVCSLYFWVRWRAVFLVLTDAAGSTIQSLLTFGNCWLIGSRAVIV